MIAMSRLGRLSMVVIPAVLAATGCHIDDLTWGCHDRGCGPQVSRNYDFSGFDSIRVEDAFDVTVRQGDAFHVEVSVPEGAEDDLDVRQDGSWLRIAGGGGCGSFARRATVELPVLRHLEAESASRVTLRGLSAPGPIQLALSAASRVEGDLEAETTILRLALASSAELSGRTDLLELTVSEASRGQLRDLLSQCVDARLSAASSATISVSDQLDVTATGASVLRYIGDPQLGRVDLSGGSRLERQR
jgi:hypothetical protein